MSTGQGYYSIGLDKTAANYVPLSPLSFLERTASVYPGRTGALYGVGTQNGPRYTLRFCRAFDGAHLA
ncbi:MAG: hypothetical protein K2X60_08700, partial [Xanthobacteraceae bacterium]|nr:hypothetical protein [Xanthobacteraceae bacterium]